MPSLGWDQRKRSLVKDGEYSLEWDRMSLQLVPIARVIRPCRNGLDPSARFRGPLPMGSVSVRPGTCPSHPTSLSFRNTSNEVLN